MTHLVAVRTVNDAAALCDYLSNRVGPDDHVTAVTVHPPDADTPDSDRQEALNVVDVRLAAPEVETVERRGDETEELLAEIEERDVETITVGRRTDAPGEDAGLSRDELQSATDVHVAVVPVTPS